MPRSRSHSCVNVIWAQYLLSSGLYQSWPAAMMSGITASMVGLLS